MRNLRIAGAALLAAMSAACVPRSAPPAPAPTPRPAPAAPAPEAPPPTLRPADWMEVELSPGDWRLGGEAERSFATFASGGSNVTIRCERNGVILIGIHDLQSRSGRALVVRTTFGERRLPTTAADANGLAASLPAGDPLFDQMAFSRGRISIGADGGPALVVPAWPEIARVTEDCRAQ